MQRPKAKFLLKSSFIEKQQKKVYADALGILKRYDIPHVKLNIASFSKVA